MESLLAVRWVSSVLTSDDTLRAGMLGGWLELPIEGSQTPWGRVESIGQSPDERGPEGGWLIWAKPTILITIFDRFGNYSRIEPIADRVNLLLNGKFYPDISGFSNGVLHSCIRDFGNQGVDNVGGYEVRRIFQQFSFLATDHQP